MRTKMAPAFRHTAVQLAIVAIVAGTSAATEPHASTPVDHGRVLYARHCASCHGPSATGGGPDADLFPTPPRNLQEGFLGRYDDETLSLRIREGRRLPMFLDRVALQRHVADVDSLLTHLRRLPSIDWNRVDAGWSSYVARCEVCHGPTGDGPAAIDTPGRPANLALRSTWKAQTEKDRRAAIRHEREGMPRLEPAVGADEGAAIAAFVDLFSPGFSLFSRHCANCHADDGRGIATLGEVAGEVFPLPAVTFDDDYFKSVDADELRGRVWHMLETNKPSMPHFRALLDDTEVRAILAFLRSTAPAAP